MQLTSNASSQEHSESPPQQSESQPEKDSKLAKQSEVSDAVKSSDESQHTQWGEVRNIQVYLVAVSRLMCYLARAQLGALLPFLIEDLNLTTTEQGYLMSRYASGYILTQIAGGVLADKHGGFIVIASVMFATALCCFMVPMFAALGSEVFGIPFFIMGVCQGAVMPAGSVLVSCWVLPSERSWATAITGMGACMGTLLVNFVAGPIATRLGWQAVFRITSLCCIGLLIVWLRLACSSPDTCKTLSQSERALLQQAGLVKQKTGDSGASKMQKPFLNLRLFFYMPVWAVLVSHLVQNCQVYFAEWLPLFYNTYLGLTPSMAALYLTMVASVELPARTLTKDMPDYFAKRGWSLLQCRKMMSLQGFGCHLVLCAIVAALMLNNVTSPLAFTVTFALSRAVQAFHSGGYFANYMDLTQDYVGMLNGVGNTLESLAGIIVPQFVTFNLGISSDNWLPIIAGGVSLNLLAISMISCFMSTASLDGAVSACAVKCCEADETSKKDRAS